MHRAHLHDVLAHAVRRHAGANIVLGARVTASEQGADSVSIATANGQVFHGDLAVGADGVHSVIRQQLFGVDKPQFSGLIAWRGVIPTGELPEHLRAVRGVNWVGPGSHVIHYPLADNAQINFVAAVERSDWQVESWNEKGTVEECLNDFRGWHEDVQTLIRSIATPYKWALMVREPMGAWTRGRITLLGDACHPTLPFLAQGTAMAIEDGYLLARALRTYASGPEQALRHYEDARKDRTAQVVRGSNANARRFHDRTLASRPERPPMWTANGRQNASTSATIGCSAMTRAPLHCK